MKVREKHKISGQEYKRKSKNLALYTYIFYNYSYNYNFGASLNSIFFLPDIRHILSIYLV